MHGACNTVLSALVVHDRYRDNKKALRNDFSEHLQTRTPERGRGADQAYAPVTVTSFKIARHRPRSSKNKEGWEITTSTCTLIGRRSHQKKKRCKTCPHGRIANRHAHQPLSKHRQGHQSSPCTSTAPCEQQGEPIKAPLHLIQASSLNTPRSSRPYATLVHRHMYISSARCPQRPIIR